MPGAMRDWILPPREGGPIRLSCCNVHIACHGEAPSPERGAAYPIPKKITPRGFFYLSAGVAVIGKIGRHVTKKKLGESHPGKLTPALSGCTALSLELGPLVGGMVVPAQVDGQTFPRGGVQTHTAEQTAPGRATRLGWPGQVRGALRGKSDRATMGYVVLAQAALGHR